ncbi:DUF4910 domain-containing protein [Planktomarina temperata]|nr:DUF4910 domain-containing protein [Planktomarina temperata]
MMDISIGDYSDKVKPPINAGSFMVNLMRELYDFPRSLTGQGVIDTLSVITREMPELQIHSVKSGTTIYDWEVPNEWNVNEAWIRDPQGNIVCDFRDNCLHLVGYSMSINGTFGLHELQSHLYSRDDLPSAVPYVTSYYKDTWGFCISDSLRKTLVEGPYEIKIDVDKKPGLMHFADLVLPGNEKNEILLSTYICHPNMANNELSGITLAISLYKYLSSLPTRRYTYRFVFVPETIGALTYLSKNLEHLKSATVAGFVLTCVGDERTYSYLPSRRDGTLADRVALAVLNNDIGTFDTYTWFDRGSDERQYCAPNVDLPICSIMRSKYGTYPEYHTSLDNIGNVVSEKGLQGSYDIYVNIINLLEANFFYKGTMFGEPFLSKRDLFPNRGVGSVDSTTRNILNFLSICDGEADLISLSQKLKIQTPEILKIVQIALNENLIERI